MNLYSSSCLGASNSFIFTDEYAEVVLFWITVSAPLNKAMRLESIMQEIRFKTVALSL